MSVASRVTRVSAVCLMLAAVAAAPANATPILYTDRAAFDLAVGDYTLLTLDAPDPISETTLLSELQSVRRFNTTYSDLLQITYDIDAFDPNAPGGWALSYAIFGAGSFATTATTLVPVTAFGFDVLNAQSTSAVFPWAGLNFWGLVSDTPFIPVVQGGGFDSHFVADNFAIQVVPEPSTLILLAVSLTALALSARHRRTDKGRT